MMVVDDSDSGGDNDNDGEANNDFFFQTSFLVINILKIQLKTSLNR